MAEQAEPVRIGELHLAEARAVDAGDAVVPRQPLVDERVVGAQQLQRAAVLAQDVREEQLGFAAEGLADVVVEVREHQDVGLDLRFEVAQLQPLAGEVADQRVGPRVGEHPPDLGRQHAGRAETAGRGQVQQRLIGDAAPEEERQPRRELDVADAAGGARAQAGRVALDPVEERRAGQHAREARADAGVERLAAPAARRVERERRLESAAVTGRR